MPAACAEVLPRYSGKVRTDHSIYKVARLKGTKERKREDNARYGWMGAPNLVWLLPPEKRHSAPVWKNGDNGEKWGDGEHHWGKLGDW